MGQIVTAPAGFHYPVHVRTDPQPSSGRWLWIVKWLLLVPHLVVLALLWVAFAVLSLVAFVAILVTSRYPRTVFDFNVGVLRWTWRVTYYGYGVLGTDRYPPFTLADVPDYPAHLDVDYPEHESRGLVLVKWWLLALPHYVVVGLLVGGGWWVVRGNGSGRLEWSGGLVGILVLVAAVVLTVTGRYPPALYNLILGLQRWVLRVCAYAALMTDRYPPFRLDLGPDEPPASEPPSSEPPAPPAPQPPGGAEGRPGAPRSGWTGGRITAVVLGSVLSVAPLVLLTGGVALVVADHAMRDPTGYLTSAERSTNSPGYAVTFSSIMIDAPAGATLPHEVLGDIRLRVTSSNTAVPVFVGIAPTAAVERYLDGVARTVARAASGASSAHDLQISGRAPSTPPTAQTIWDASSVGTRTQELRWTPRAGDWAVVVMNADGSDGVAATASAGAQLPWLGPAGVAFTLGGLVLLTVGIILITVATRRANQRHGP